MSDFSIVPADMAAASAAAGSAAGDARGADGSDALASLSTALPGSTTAEVAPLLRTVWRDGVDGWATAVDDFAAAIDAATAEADATDQHSGGLLGLLRGRVGGPR